MKKMFIICAFCIMLATIQANSSQRIHIAPDYITSFYDQYTHNILNTRSLGMGNATVAVRGGIEAALLNPASFKGGEVQIYVEGHIKGETEEMNRYIHQRIKADGDFEPIEVPDERQNLEAGLPAITLGMGYSLSDYLSLGGSFAMPQTVRYNLFGRLLKTGAYLDRMPTMQNYQGMATLNSHFNNLNIGLNVIMNVYRFRDLRIENTFDRVRFTETVFRIQPGVLYEKDNWSVGVSYKLPVEKKFEVGNIPHSLYHTYDTTLPGLLDAGVTLSINDVMYAAAVEYEQTSAQYDGFDDRLKIKAGVENKLPDFSLRGGFMYIPGIYTGKHHSLTGARATDDEFPFEFDVAYSYLEVENTDQLIITGGFTYPFPLVDFSMGFAADVLGKLDMFQLSMSFGIKIQEMMRETDRRRTY